MRLWSETGTHCRQSCNNYGGGSEHDDFLKCIHASAALGVQAPPDFQPAALRARARSTSVIEFHHFMPAISSAVVGVDTPLDYPLPLVSTEVLDVTGVMSSR